MRSFHRNPAINVGFGRAYLLCLLGVALFVSSCAVQKNRSVNTQAEHNNPALTLTTNIESPENVKDTQPIASNPLLVDISPEDLEMSKAQAKRIYHRSWKTIGIRSRYVRKRLLTTLESLHAPTSLQVLPAVESTYDPYALSPAGALGLWQIMPRTAQILGIRSEKEKNGRRNINDSTSAAIRYLQEMHERFNSWPLAIAAYNLGPYAVEKRLKKSPWKTADGLENMPIPTSTRAYVQHVIGLAALLQDETFDFPEPVETRPITIQSPVDIQRLAKISGMAKDEIFRFNPSLNQAQYLHNTIHIHVPVSIFKTMQEKIALSGPVYVNHTIKTGDNLWDLARSYNTSVNRLKSLNKNMGKYLRIGQRLRVPANRLAQAVADHNPLLSDGHRIRYKVRNGDSLWLIANQFGTSPKAIARANQISLNHVIRAGDILWVFAKVRPS
ncbi:MAG: transglycosylase SLT domain-containing protein [Mariprofundus sp.]|nr:transglycosylase SLT domain-containing protein [Mariprofundus sp.]